MNNNLVKPKWYSSGSLILAVLAVVIAAAAFGGKFSKTTDSSRHITVNGHSELKIDPDTAYVSLGVITRNKTSRNAADENARISNAVIRAIKSVGITDKDIQTRNYSIQPWVKYTDKGEEYLGYEVYNTVRVTVRDIKKISDVTDSGTNAGANSVQGISFGVDDDEGKKREALAKAVENAKKRAESVAKTLGASVGKPLTIKETGGENTYEYDRYTYNNYVAAKNVSLKRMSPINPGQLLVKQDVQVTFAIDR